MTILETLAQRVVDRWEKGDLAEAVRALDEQLKKIAAERATYAAEIETARRLQTDELEIDDDPMISEADEHVWVSAWIYVPRKDIDPEDTPE